MCQRIASGYFLIKVRVEEIDKETKEEERERKREV
jgi:hypothetical protein